MTIFIGMEIKTRELESNVLLALEAAKRGHMVILSHKSLLRKILEKGFLKGIIYHDKSISMGKELYFKKFKKYDNYITSLDQEHGLLPTDYNPFMKRRYPKSSVEYIDKIFTWGDYDYNHLINYHETNKKRFYNTGSPRVDLWKINSKIDKNFAEKKIILILSSMGGILTPKINHEDPNNQDYRRLFDAYIKLIKELAVKNPQLSIVLRPHPKEISEHYEKLLKNIKNLKITKEGTLFDWLKESKVVIHSGSTSGFETAYLGVPTISYTPFSSEIFDRKTISMGMRIQNHENVIKMVTEFDLDKFMEIQKNSLKELSDYFKNINSNYAYISIVNEWDELKKEGKINHKYLHIVFVFNLAKILLKIKMVFNRLRYVFKPKVSKNINPKWGGLDFQEILEIRNRLIQIDTSFEKVKITRLIKGYYIFESYSN